MPIKLFACFINNLVNNMENVIKITYNKGRVYKLSLTDINETWQICKSSLLNVMVLSFGAR